MSRSLPGRPNREHLRNQARQLQRACRSGQVSAIRLLRAHLPRLAGQPRDGGGWHTGITVQEAQFALARDYGFESWPKMTAFVDEKADQLRFADSVKEIIELANAEATRRGSPEVGPGHLLLALAGEEIRPLAGPLLEGLGVAPDEVRRLAESRVSSGSSHCDESRFNPALRRVLECAADEARGSGRHDVHVEHLLLGLLKDRDADVARWRESTGLRYKAVKEMTAADRGLAPRGRRAGRAEKAAGDTR